MARISHITLPDNTDYSIQATGIFYGEVASTSTSTVFTATIPGITEYYDGLTILLRNGVVTSAANFTININGLGAKGSYSNMSLGNPITPTNPTRVIPLLLVKVVGFVIGVMMQILILLVIRFVLIHLVFQ